MGERKAVNKYYPPDFDPEKHGTLNAYHHHHPLGYRARKLRTEGAIIMRFEMPFNAWCDTCQTHLPRGARFNAEQRNVGNYFSTKIYSFTMRCPCCGCTFVIETDPANADYRATAGATRKVEEWSQESSEGYALESEASKERRKTDVLYRMEKQRDDTDKAKSLRRGLVEAAKAQKATAADDYTANSLARKIMRTRREEEERQKSECRALGLTMLKKLEAPTEKDEVEVQAVHLQQSSAQAPQQWRANVLSAVCGDAFGPKSANSEITKRAFAVVASQIKSSEDGVTDHSSRRHSSSSTSTTTTDKAAAQVMEAARIVTPPSTKRRRTLPTTIDL